MEKVTIFRLHLPFPSIAPPSTSPPREGLILHLLGCRSRNCYQLLVTPGYILRQMRALVLNLAWACAPMGLTCSYFAKGSKR